MPQDPEFAAMLRRFAALGRSDRDFVVAELGEPAALALSALLVNGNRKEFSESLVSAISDIRSGGLPSGMTLQTAAALEEIATAREEAEGASQAPKPSSNNRSAILGSLLNYFEGRY